MGIAEEGEGEALLPETSKDDILAKAEGRAVPIDIELKADGEGALSPNLKPEDRLPPKELVFGVSRSCGSNSGEGFRRSSSSSSSSSCVFPRPLNGEDRNALELNDIAELGTVSDAVWADWEPNIPTPEPALLEKLAKPVPPVLGANPPKADPEVTVTGAGSAGLAAAIFGAPAVLPNAVDAPNVGTLVAAVSDGLVIEKAGTLGGPDPVGVLDGAPNVPVGSAEGGAGKVGTLVAPKPKGF